MRKASIYQLWNVAAALFFIYQWQQKLHGRIKYSSQQLWPDFICDKMDAHAEAAWSFRQWALCWGVMIIDNISAGNRTQSGYEEHPEALKDAIIILHTASTELQAICHSYRGQKRFRYQVRNEKEPWKEAKNWMKENMLTPVSVQWVFLLAGWSMKGGWLVTGGNPEVSDRMPPLEIFPSVSQSEVMCYLSSLWNGWLSWRWVRNCYFEDSSVVESVHVWV